MKKNVISTLLVFIVCSVIFTKADAQQVKKNERALSKNDPTPTSSSTCSEYKIIEKTIRQTWGTPDLIVTPFLNVGGTDAKWFALSPMAKNVFGFTAIRVESATDAGRWHGVNERVLISEYAKSIGFFYQLIVNLKELK